VTEPEKGIISPLKMSEALHMGIGSLAHLTRVNRTTLAKSPESEKVQSSLGLIARIIGMASALSGDDPGKAVLWFRHQPIPAFDLKTPEELVEAGWGDAVIRHLEMLADGVYA
jgi:uncharacterized protein (DUF2384 family)